MVYIYDIEIYKNFFLINFLNSETKEKFSFQISKRKDFIENNCSVEYFTMEGK